MSRQAQAIQPSVSIDEDNIPVKLPQQMITCPFTMDIFFEPVMAMPCGHCFEYRESIKLKDECPCCRTQNIALYPAPPIIRELLLETLKQHPKLYEQVHFDIDYFEEIVLKNDFAPGTAGEKFLLLLQNSTTHLNQKPTIRTERQMTFPGPRLIPEYQVIETIGESAIEILAGTPAGRNLLQKKLIIKSAPEKYFFGNAEISAESLQIHIDGKSIREWLITTAMEVAPTVSVDSHAEAFSMHQ